MQDILFLEQQMTVGKKLLTKQMSMLETAIAFPGVLIFHRYKYISTDNSTPLTQVTYLSIQQIKETGKSKHC